jgi:hypothetical protein
LGGREKGCGTETASTNRLVVRSVAKCWKTELANDFALHRAAAATAAVDAWGRHLDWGVRNIVRAGLRRKGEKDKLQMKSLLVVEGLGRRRERARPC